MPVGRRQAAVDARGLPWMPWTCIDALAREDGTWHANFIPGQRGAGFALKNVNFLNLRQIFDPIWRHFHGLKD